MRTVNVHEAKTHFSALIAEVQGGEEIVIAKAGRPVARLVQLQAPARERVLGADRDLDFWIADDFDTFVPDELSAYLP